MKQLQYIFFILVVCFFSSCQSDTDTEIQQTGYLRLNIESTNSLETKAEAEYNPKMFSVKILNEQNEVVKIIEDVTAEKKDIELEAGAYTVQAYSANFDKESGFDKPYYAGSQKVEIAKGETEDVSITCTLANVLVTVGFSQELKEKFAGRTIAVSVGPKTTGAYMPLNFDLEKEGKKGYIPVGEFQASISIEKPAGEVGSYTMKNDFEGKAKTHYKIMYKLKQEGSGDFTVKYDPSTNTYTYDVPLSTTSVNAASLTANAWGRFAYLKAMNVNTASSVDGAKLKFQYKAKDAETWIGLETTLVEDVYTAKVAGLTANTAYEYRLTDGEENFEVSDTFTTEEEVLLRNMSLDNWYMKETGTLIKKKTFYCCLDADFDSRIWDSGNDGANTMGTVNPTSPETTDVVKGSAALLESKTAAGQFAAGSLFTGRFIKATLSPLGANLNFGYPYTSRPSKLKGHYKYVPANVSHVDERVPQVKNGQRDSCSIYIVLTTWEKEFDVSTGDDRFVDLSSKDIIAYGELSKEEMCPSQDMTNYQPFSIDLKYRDLDRKPTYILMVCSSSKYGDYFVGGEGSKLWVDELSFEFEEPTIDEDYIKQ